MNRKRIFKVSYIGATNIKGSRVKIHDLRNNVSKIIPYDYAVSGIYNMAINYLTDRGIDIDSVSCTDSADYLMTNDFSTPIK